MQRLAADLDVLMIRPLLVVVVNVAWEVAAFVDAAQRRIAVRRFLKEHPEVTIYYPDGERQ